MDITFFLQADACFADTFFIPLSMFVVNTEEGSNNEMSILTSADN